MSYGLFEYADDAIEVLKGIRDEIKETNRLLRGVLARMEQTFDVYEDRG